MAAELLPSFVLCTIHVSYRSCILLVHLYTADLSCVLRRVSIDVGAWLFGVLDQRPLKFKAQQLAALRCGCGEDGEHAQTPRPGCEPEIQRIGSRCVVLRALVGYCAYESDRPLHLRVCICIWIPPATRLL